MYYYSVHLLRVYIYCSTFVYYSVHLLLMYYYSVHLLRVYIYYVPQYIVVLPSSSTSTSTPVLHSTTVIHAVLLNYT
eukprot:COSAG02_NODE_1839_length_10707_cov_7.098793_9_plen_77_part_00